MEVASVFDSKRGVVSDEITTMPICISVDDVVVMVHRYHPSRQGVIVAITLSDLLPSYPVKRFKFTKIVASPNDANCAKLFVPRLRYTLLVIVVVAEVINCVIYLGPFVTSAIIRNTPTLLTNSGKFVDDEKNTLDRARPIILVVRFVRDSFLSKPF